MAESNLHKLSKRGQSVWIDSLSRTMLDSGELARLMKEDAVVGVTTNPTIFQKALAPAMRYDEQLKELLETETDPKEIFLQLSSRDVEAALDLMREVHEQQRAGRLRLVGGRPDARVRPRGHLRRGDAPPRVARPAEPLREDPGHEAGPRCDRRLHRDRQEHQRDADLLARALPRGRRGVSARPRAACRLGRRSLEGALGRELLRVARRHRGRQAARRDRDEGGACAARQARDRKCEARVRALPAGILRPALGLPCGQGRDGRSGACGRRRRRRTRSTAM